MRLGQGLIVGLVLLAAATSTAVAMDNTAPFAEAGLDQTVPPNTTVYLDANGSTDPDGSVAAVKWTVRDPDGRTHSPDCVDCRRTYFEATTVGQYTVTLTVTDDDGAASSDRLHATVATDDGPTVSLSGPSTATPNSEMTMTADASKAEASLQSLAWVVNGSVVAQRDIGGDSASESMTHSFDDTGPKSVSAVVYDSLGNRGTGSHTVVVAPRTTGASGNDGGSGGGLCHEPSGLCGSGDMVYSYGEGEPKYIVDSNGEEGIQRGGPSGNQVIDYGDLSTVDGVERLDGTGDRPEALQGTDASVKITDPDLTIDEALEIKAENDPDVERPSGDSDPANTNTNTGSNNDDTNSDPDNDDNGYTQSDPSDDRYVSDDDGGVTSSASLSGAISGSANDDGGDSGGSDDGGSDDSGGGGLFGGLFGGGDNGGDGGGSDDGGSDDSGGDGLFGGLF